MDVRALPVVPRLSILIGESEREGEGEIALEYMYMYVHKVGVVVDPSKRFSHIRFPIKKIFFSFRLTCFLLSTESTA